MHLQKRKRIRHEDAPDIQLTGVGVGERGSLGVIDSLKKKLASSKQRQGVCIDSLKKDQKFKARVEEGRSGRKRNRS